ncbi:MAG TPA: AmmeMemoRadiSam system protein A [Bacteroidota bacterium]|jgi:AmmeMemoRadiSam system protein A
MDDRTGEIVLSVSEKAFLLELARDSIESAVRGKPPASIGPCEPALLRPQGAFVTLRISGELRGCIGYVDPLKPLAHTVQEAAVKAALDDQRFPPVGPDELDALAIEISVLSPLIKMEQITDIEVGTHGLLIGYGGNRGLLLPQVPLEHGWDRETFLSQTAKKAGLPPRIWERPGAETYLFTAEIFEEESEARGKR